MRPHLAAAWASFLLLAVLPFAAPAQDEVPPPEPSEAAKKLAEATDNFHKGREAVDARYRKDLTAVIAAGDRVEVYLLDFEPEKAEGIDSENWDLHIGKEKFPITPYGMQSKILKTAVLTAEQRAEFLSTLQKTVGGEIEGGGAFCHYPIHGVRVFSKDEIVFQSSFCWHCGNFFIRYPYGASWTGIPNPAEISKAFEKLVPIPQAELDRFNDKYGPKMNEEEYKEK